MAATFVTITGVFGSKKDIGDIVKDFDFTKVSDSLKLPASSPYQPFQLAQININNATLDDYLHEGLAPSFSKLNGASIKQMDGQLKAAIASTTRALAKIPTQVNLGEGHLDHDAEPHPRT
jgi:hypothetical protein